MIKKALPILTCALLCVNLLSGCHLARLAGGRPGSAESAAQPESSAFVPEPIAIQLRFGENGGSVPRGSVLSLSVQVSGARPPVELEIWLNGAPFAARRLEVEDYRPLFDLPWVMGEQNAQILLRVTDASGAQGTSNILSLTAVGAFPGYTEVSAAAGDTRAAIAARFGVETAAVVVPGLTNLAETMEIPLNARVQVYPGGGEAQAPPAPVLPEGFTALGAPLKGGGGKPTLEVKLVAGAPQVSYSSPAADTTALVLYRADARDGRFKPIQAQEVTRAGETFTFSDEQAVGEYIYYFAAAINPSGQVSGDIVGARPAEMGQGGVPALPAVYMRDDGSLGVKNGIERLYFYASLDQAQYKRVPEAGFIRVQDGRVDLTPYFNRADGDAKQPARLEMEVWSWDGNAPQRLGFIDTLLNRTSLKVCTVPSARCRGIGSGDVPSPEFTEGTADTHTPDGTTLLFPWDTSQPYEPGALVQVSLLPYTSSEVVNPPGLVYARGIQGECGAQGCGGVFAIDFAQLFVEEKAGQVMGETAGATFKPLGNLEFSGSVLRQMLDRDILGASRQPGLTFGGDHFNLSSITPLDLYVRVIPIAGMQPSGAPSNTVVIHYGAKEAAQVTLFPTATPPPQPPQVVDARIVDFSGPIPPSLPWGCVYITAVNAGAYQEKYYRSLMNAHKAYCPQPYRGRGEQPWYESMWEFTTGAVDQVAQYYEEIKMGVVANVASALDSAGICHNCEALISTALTVGLVALGIPPELPDMSKLTDMGVDSLVEQASAAMGVPCDAACREILREGIKDFADQMNTKTVSLYQDEEEAHKHGMQPLFVPPGVSVAPAKEANWQMASLRVQVWRKPGTEALSAHQLKAIESALYITAEGYNDQSGRSYTVFHCWQGGCDLINPAPGCDAVAVPGCPETRTVTAPLEGALFQPVILETGGDLLPYLAPGETRVFDLVMVPAIYWIPGHEEETTYEWYDDWGYLYEGGTARIALDMTARACVKNLSGYAPSCSSTAERTDYREIQLPDTSTYGFNQMWTSK